MKWEKEYDRIVDNYKKTITKNCFLFGDIKSWININFILRKNYDSLEKILDKYEYEIMLLKDKLKKIRNILNEKK